MEIKKFREIPLHFTDIIEKYEKNNAQHNFTLNGYTLRRRLERLEEKDWKCRGIVDFFYARNPETSPDACCHNCRVKDKYYPNQFYLSLIFEENPSINGDFIRFNAFCTRNCYIYYNNRYFNKII